MCEPTGAKLYKINLEEHKTLYVYIYIIYIYIIKGSLGGETSVLRTFRMSGKELVKETVSQRKS